MSLPLPVEFLLAPPASGKTHICIQRIQALRKTDPLAPVWVIVPDRLQAAAFRRRLAQVGGAMGVQVGRFPDLYRHILEREGSFQPAASLPLLQRLIQQIVDQAVEDGAIPYYQPLQLFPGFIAVLRDAFAELKRALVTPSQFSAYAHRGTPAQQDLAELYARYQQRLNELGWRDAEEVTWQALEVLERNPESVSAIRLLVVDGFDSFNGSQYRVLKLLAGQAGELLVTFPGVRGSPRPAHRRFVTSIERLVSDLNPSVTTLDNSPYLPAPIDRLERHLFEVNPPPETTVERPLLIEARSPAEEAREALRWVKSLVVREEIPLGSCAIYTPNPEVYHPLLRAAAAEFGVPLYITLDEPLEQSPAINTLLNLLALPLRRYNSRYLLNSLRSPYFEFSIDEETIDVLEMVSRVGQVVESREQWEEVWERLVASSAQEKLELDDERNSPALPRGAAAASLRTTLRAVFELLTPPQEERPLTGWITWLEELLERLRFFENAGDERDLPACETFHDVLRALVVSDAVTGQQAIAYTRFLADLQSALAAEGFRESRIIGQPALLVGRITEARGTRFNAVALLGLSEGSFPVNERPDPFLSEELRTDLGLELRLEREQAGLFYQAITRADRHLLITRPYLSDDGEELEESAYWKSARALFTDQTLSRIKADAQRPLTEAASTQELLFSAVRRRSLPQAYNFLLSRWQDLQQVQGVLAARRAKQAAGAFEGEIPGISPLMRERFSPQRVWSASRLESYGFCPFWFFASTALEVEPRSTPELGLDATQLGSILHKILELTYLHAEDRMQVNSLLESLSTAAAEVFATAPQVFGFRPSPLWQNEQVQLLHKLQETILALSEQPGWRPIGFEAKFGIKDEPLLSIELDGEQVLVRGVVDRIDCNDSGGLRVIDYKTGGAHMDKKDLLKGYRLQLPIYALAARDALQLGDPVDGFYWKIMAADASPLKLAKFSSTEGSGVEGAIRVTRQHLRRIVSGIRAAQFQPKKPDGGCPGYCPAAQWCWRFEAAR